MAGVRDTDPMEAAELSELSALGVSSLVSRHACHPHTPSAVSMVWPSLRTDILIY